MQTNARVRSSRGAALLPCALALLAPAIAVRAGRADQYPDTIPGKKLIAAGHDEPTPRQLRRDLREMEKRPFDGVVLAVTAEGQDAGIPGVPFEAAFANRRWKRAWFGRAVEDLKAVEAARPKHLRHNFVKLNANPGGVDWFDDEGWENVADHWRIAAWVARQGGLKGIAFDPEPYAEPFRQFTYTAQPGRREHSFDEYYAKARERGRQAMRAVVEEYPDVTVLTYFMNSYAVTWTPFRSPLAAPLPDPRRGLALHAYGLYPPFVDGWLDVAPPGVTLVDGDERAYAYTAECEFLKAAVRIKRDGQELVSPANRAKYRAQVQAGFGIYLDAHHPTLVPPYALDARGMPYVELLRKDVTAALEAADEYVWVYGEQGRWWPDPTDAIPWKRKVYPPWPEVLPGVEAALRAARDPQTAELQRALDQVEAMRRAGTLKELARNGDFRSGGSPGGSSTVPPAEWTAWQEADSRGEFGWDPATGADRPGAARAANVLAGDFIQANPVRPGQRYLVSARYRLRGKGEAFLRVRWQTADEKWTGERFDKDILAAPKENGVPVGWRDLQGVVTVPPHVGRLAILLGVMGQSSPEDVAWFDDIHLHLLP